MTGATYDRLRDLLGYKPAPSGRGMRRPLDGATVGAFVERIVVESLDEIERVRRG